VEVIPSVVVSFKKRTRRIVNKHVHLPTPSNSKPNPYSPPTLSSSQTMRSEPGDAPTKCDDLGYNSAVERTLVTSSYVEDVVDVVV